ncbi:MAG: hypothetical protein J6P03_03600, partial [Opitutales bacterium]|nr:hypothetical protein [Opitutales bacterium]
NAKHLPRRGENSADFAKGKTKRASPNAQAFSVEGAAFAEGQGLALVLAKRHSYSPKARSQNAIG